MTLSLRRSLFAVAGVGLAACLAACSAGTSPEIEASATSGADAAAIGVETTDLFVAVRNNAGRPLERVQITIRVVGNAPPFTATVNRMENGERREISPSSFRSNDGTTFSPRLHRARQVSVSAADIVGKKYEVSRAWKR